MSTQDTADQASQLETLKLLVEIKNLLDKKVEGETLG